MIDFVRETESQKRLAQKHGQARTLEWCRHRISYLAVAEVQCLYKIRYSFCSPQSVATIPDSRSLPFLSSVAIDKVGQPRYTSFHACG